MLPARASVPAPDLARLNAPEMIPEIIGLPDADAMVLLPVRAILAIIVPVPIKLKVPFKDTWLMEAVEPLPKFQFQLFIFETVPNDPALNVRLALGLAVRLNLPFEPVHTSEKPTVFTFQACVPDSVSVWVCGKNLTSAVSDILTVKVPVAALMAAEPRRMKARREPAAPLPLPEKRTLPFVVTFAAVLIAIPRTLPPDAIPARVKLPPDAVMVGEPVSVNALLLPPPVA